MENERFPLIALRRLRMGTDGRGVTTLAFARGCPLRCRYCLNPLTWREGTPFKWVTPRELRDLVRRDDLYFQATGGGVTFGGGEPLLYAGFIARFGQLCAGRWRVTVETCLNVPEASLRSALEGVDEFIVDVKDLDPDIYRRYTGADNGQMLRNLETLIGTAGPRRVLARVPAIPGYNTPEDVARSIEGLKAMGVERINAFTYVAPVTL